ncbi:MAG: hypothetical protein WB798_15635 [Nocardioidaceae bacterium]
MTLHTKAVVTAVATLALAWAAAAPPALARWAFHDDSVGERITAPPGGTRAQTCAGRLNATSGFGHFIDVDAGEDPAAYQLPAQARAAVAYEVWKAPTGFRSFGTAVQDVEAGQVYFEDPDGTRHQATVVGRVTTRPRAVLATPVPANGNRDASDSFIFTTAPLSVPLRATAPGNVLGLTPAGHGGGIFVTVTAIDCRVPIRRARVDVVPGSQRNTVHPTQTQELVPVRVFGGPRLRVGRISQVHLGEAAPASVPPELEPTLRPRDVNGDGRPDRLYYFRQGDTDIQCIDRDVRVTGRTSDGNRFQGRSAITTAGCEG